MRSARASASTHEAGTESRAAAASASRRGAVKGAGPGVGFSEASDVWAREPFPGIRPPPVGLNSARRADLEDGGGVLTSRAGHLYVGGCVADAARLDM